MKHPVAVNQETLYQAAQLLRAGGLVAFPTETYYGLAVDPYNGQALDRLFTIKQRPRQQPILVLVAGLGQLPLLASSVPLVYRRLIDRFWPGPLTLVCPALASLPPQLTAQTETIALRHSPHPTAKALLAAYNSPLTATSANRSGLPAAVSAQEVADIFGDAIDMILDGGPTPGGSGSTLVGIKDGELACIREGKIAFTAVQHCVAEFLCEETWLAWGCQALHSSGKLTAAAGSNHLQG